MKYELGKSITSLFRPGILGIPDKAKAEGLIVSLQGNEIVTCGRRGKPFGVYTAGSSRKILLLNGDRVEITIPEGIIYQGEAHAKVSKR